ncbi:MAG TPA: hypothetical protein VEW05_07795 [Candidatus Polarisedimenticolia bacterium]|nr:hypothetical protein [Candidatus Polarisedimenticolia bacterium]
MPRSKKKYSYPTPITSAPLVVSEPTPYSFDLKGASKYTGYSVWSLRQAIHAKQLPVVNQKPYLIRRADLEAFVDSRVQKAA